MSSTSGWRLPVPPVPLAFLWAVAEATFWPLMPDAVLAPLAGARPRSWWRLTLAATAGSVCGGAISYFVGRITSPGPVLARLPLIRPSMVEAADTWLVNEGAIGVRHQALSGLPFKVFALLAGSRGAPLVPFLLWAGLVRGTRFAVAAGGAGFLGWRFRGQVKRHPALLLALWTLVFGTGLWRMVVAWERRSPESRNRARTHHFGH